VAEVFPRKAAAATSFVEEKPWRISPNRYRGRDKLPRTPATWSACEKGGRVRSTAASGAKCPASPDEIPPSVTLRTI